MNIDFTCKFFLFYGTKINKACQLFIFLNKLTKVNMLLIYYLFKIILIRDSREKTSLNIAFKYFYRKKIHNS